MNEDYWKERCLAAEKVISNSGLVQNLGDKGGSYTPEWYKAKEEWMKIKDNKNLVR
jgi:hypothetical protein